MNFSKCIQFIIFYKTISWWRSICFLLSSLCWRIMWSILMELLAHKTHHIAIKPCFSISKFLILKNINTDKLLNLKINNSKIEYIALRETKNFRHFIVFLVNFECELTVICSLCRKLIVRVYWLFWLFFPIEFWEEKN